MPIPIWLQGLVTNLCSRKQVQYQIGHLKVHIHFLTSIKAFPFLCSITTRRNQPSPICCDVTLGITHMWNTWEASRPGIQACDCHISVTITVHCTPTRDHQCKPHLGTCPSALTANTLAAHTAPHFHARLLGFPGLFPQGLFWFPQCCFMCSCKLQPASTHNSIPAAVSDFSPLLGLDTLWGTDLWTKSSIFFLRSNERSCSLGS